MHDRLPRPDRKARADRALVIAEPDVLDLEVPKRLLSARVVVEHGHEASMSRHGLENGLGVAEIDDQDRLAQDVRGRVAIAGRHQLNAGDLPRDDPGRGEAVHAVGVVDAEVGAQAHSTTPHCARNCARNTGRCC